MNSVKQERQRVILELVSTEQIGTQDDLIEKLRGRGVEVTQATVSRDIRELKLTKTVVDNGVYCYAVPQTQTVSFGSGFRSMIAEAVRSVEAAQNIIVLRTHSGLAQPVALGIDTLGLPEILGCVAGDDTVIAVSQTVESAAVVAARLHDLLKSV